MSIPAVATFAVRFLAFNRPEVAQTWKFVFQDLTEPFRALLFVCDFFLRYHRLNLVLLPITENRETHNFGHFIGQIVPLIFIDVTYFVVRASCVD